MKKEGDNTSEPMHVVDVSKVRARRLASLGHSSDNESGLSQFGNGPAKQNAAAIAAVATDGGRGERGVGGLGRRATGTSNSNSGSRSGSSSSMQDGTRRTPKLKPSQRISAMDRISESDTDSAGDALHSHHHNHHHDYNQHKRPSFAQQSNVANHMAQASNHNDNSSTSNNSNSHGNSNNSNSSNSSADAFYVAVTFPDGSHTTVVLHRGQPVNTVLSRSLLRRGLTTNDHHLLTPAGDVVAWQAAIGRDVGPLRSVFVTPGAAPSDTSPPSTAKPSTATISSNSDSNSSARHHMVNNNSSNGSNGNSGNSAAVAASASAGGRPRSPAANKKKISLVRGCKGKVGERGVMR